MVGDLLSPDFVISDCHSFEPVMEATNKIFKQNNGFFTDIETGNAYSTAITSMQTYIDKRSLKLLSDYYGKLGKKKFVHSNSTEVHNKVKQLHRKGRI